MGKKRGQAAPWLMTPEGDTRFNPKSSGGPRHHARMWLTPIFLMHPRTRRGTVALPWDPADATEWRPHLLACYFPPELMLSATF